MLLESLNNWNVHLRWQWWRHMVIWIWNAKSNIYNLESNLHWSRGLYNGSHCSESYLESGSPCSVTDGYFWRYNVVRSEWHLLLRTRKKQRNPQRSCSLHSLKTRFHFAYHNLERHWIPKTHRLQNKKIKKSPVCSVHNLEQELRLLSWVLQGSDACVRQSPFHLSSLSVLFWWFLIMSQECCEVHSISRQLSCISGVVCEID